MAQRVALNRNSAVALLSSVLALGLCSFQFGDRNNLNSMPFARVRPLVSDLAKAQQLAKQGNIELLAGKAVPGESVRLRGELSDANCYFASHTHAYDHAFCAKVCVTAGSPLVFISDQGGQVYFVLTAQNAVPIPNDVLDSIGVPGITAKGKMLASNDLRVFAVEALDKPSDVNLSKH
jgi:hypothetical protein